MIGQTVGPGEGRLQHVQRRPEAGLIGHRALAKAGPVPFRGGHGILGQKAAQPETPDARHRQQEGILRPHAGLAFGLAEEVARGFALLKFDRWGQYDRNDLVQQGVGERLAWNAVAVEPTGAQPLEPGPQHHDLADAIGRHMEDRYGSADAIVHHLAGAARTPRRLAVPHRDQHIALRHGRLTGQGIAAIT